MTMHMHLRKYQASVFTVRQVLHSWMACHLYFILCMTQSLAHNDTVDQAKLQLLYLGKMSFLTCKEGA